MRSIRLLAATTVILLGAAACGGDGDDGGVGPNTNPVANFNAPPTGCTVGAACTFTDASSDPDGQITARNWAFGDGNTSNEINPSHTYTTAGTFSVQLTVTDNGGATHSVSKPVVVNPVTTNTPPTAAFTVPSCVVNVPCPFTDESTDPDNDIITWSWNFGDGSAPVPDQHPSHIYATAGFYDVTLTVTDDDGATHTSPTQTVTVSGAAAEDCAASGATTVTCALEIPQSSTVTLTLVSSACELVNNTVRVDQPLQTIFSNSCRTDPGTTRPVRNANGTPRVFQAGATLSVTFIQGIIEPDDPPAGAPSARVSEAPGGWILNIDDGGNAAAPRDYDDVVVQVTLTPTS